ncbi:acetoacetate-CoA ligase [Fonsecaea monophora]|uniref:Acetoacetate-CoA ligase n=1 Tax=Fonsecaea monophora TaxID=254056 RepID=A0A177FKJ6_9EURO|nr:acetoacetate-CoA ligase [Fonsecaea monophora]KAH0843982.1 Acetoacetyl-CoA synthetase [Fonsecaea pedrosoi]OAG43669.1 acetoacetate-CoA ligase [Fonsecaea monophora]
MASSKIETPEVVWRPDNPETTELAKYRHHVNDKFKTKFRNTRELQRWSTTKPHDFWIDLYTYLDLVPALPQGTRKAYEDTSSMSSIPRFFPDVRLNYSENVFCADRQSNDMALIEVREDHFVQQNAARYVTWQTFREDVRKTVSALKRSGVVAGDRVGAIVATSGCAVTLFYAAAAMGAIFTSISPEIGVEGCVSRLDQVTPKILFVDSHVLYKGKVLSTAEKLKTIVSRLKERPAVYVVPIADSPPDWPSIDQFWSKASPADELRFERVPFNHPLMICYSSGTTGAPKCIVHQHGLILQHKKISVVHNNLSYRDVILQYSSTSWVVFYTMCSHLSSGGTLLVYNGSPLYPDAKQLFRICEKYRVTYLGVSPRLLLEVELSNTIPKLEFDLSSLKTVYCTGAPLSGEQYRWFYRSMPPKAQICNVAGGTETATSVLALDTCAPVYVGEIQIAALGMDVDILDPDTGESKAASGEAGEMVIRKPFPSMPCFFWGDVGGKIYRAAYFERFPHIDCWAVHDWLSQNPQTGGYVMHGRSDGVLNPSGIRFGSGEIYAIIEAPPFTNYISNSLCVGRRRRNDPDEQVFLFLVMKPGILLDEALRTQIRSAIREGLSPRHVPKFVLAAPDIPVTVNGKKVETAVKKILNGEKVVPSSTVQNPGSLSWFEKFRFVESESSSAKL